MFLFILLSIQIITSFQMSVTEVYDDSAELYNPPCAIQSNLPHESAISDREALIAVKMAEKFKQMKKFKKAKMLLQHAMALSPNHHDVLVSYGEFLELNEDFINADHLYLKALMIRPSGSPALINRNRTLPVVNKIDIENLTRIDEKGSLISLEKKNQLIEKMYIDFIYHSAAMEGNNMNFEEVQNFLKTGLAVEDKSVLEHNEILGIEAALRYVMQTLVSKNYFITVADIIAIHRLVMGHIDPISVGSFRKSQVFIAEHTPPAASDVEHLMEEFIQQLQSPHITNMHPIHIAAFAHHKLVFIHPFDDGNGRTARLLMNLFFLRYGYPLIIIRKEDQSQYYKHLKLANEGDIRPFYRFIAYATEYTLDAFLDAHESKNLQITALESKYDNDSFKSLVLKQI